VTNTLSRKEKITMGLRAGAAEASKTTSPGEVQHKSHRQNIAEEPMTVTTRTEGTGSGSSFKEGSPEVKDGGQQGEKAPYERWAPLLQKKTSLHHLQSEGSNRKKLNGTYGEGKINQGETGFGEPSKRKGSLRRIRGTVPNWKKKNHIS